MIWCKALTWRLESYNANVYGSSMNSVNRGYSSGRVGIFNQFMVAWSMKLPADQSQLVLVEGRQHVSVEFLLAG